MANLPLDMNALAHLLGTKDVEILQLRHQIYLMNEKILSISQENKKIQRDFDASVDAKDMPSGATTASDPYVGD